MLDDQMFSAMTTATALQPALDAPSSGVAKQETSAATSATLVQSRGCSTMGGTISRRGRTMPRSRLSCALAETTRPIRPPQTIHGPVCLLPTLVLQDKQPHHPGSLFIANTLTSEQFCSLSVGGQVFQTSKQHR